MNSPSIPSQAVFLHIFPIIFGTEDCSRSVQIAPEVSVHIYRIKESAARARALIGGVVIETTSDRLAGSVDNYNLDTNPEDHIQQDSVSWQGSAFNDPRRLPTAWLMLDESLPFEHSTMRVRGEKQRIPCLEFSPDSAAWIEEFEKQSGITCEGW